MKQSFPFIIFFLLLLPSTQAGKLTISHTKKGPVATNENGDVVIPARYTSISGISDEIYRVYDGKFCGLYNSEGKRLLDVVYKSIYQSYGNLLVKNKKDLYGLYSLKGKFIIKAVCQEIDNEKGYCRYRYKGKWGAYIHKTKWKIAPKYDSISKYRNDRFVVTQGERYKHDAMLINGKGQQLYSIFGGIDYSTDKLYVIYSNRHKAHGLINYHGKVLIQPSIEWFGEASEGAIIYKENGLFGYLSYKGKVLSKAQFNLCRPFKNGKAEVSCAGVYYTLNKRFEFEGLLKDTLVPYRVGSLEGYRTQKGKIIIKAQYDEARAFYNNLAVVSKETRKGVRYGMINRHNFAICPFDFNNIGPGSDSLHYASKRINGKTRYGYIGKRGNWIIEPQFDTAKSFLDGLAWVEKDGKKFQINKYGRKIKK